MNLVIVREGLRSGAILSLCAVVLAVLGLTPALSWISEALLIGAAFVLPVAILVWTGFRSARRSGRLVAGLFTGALAGAMLDRSSFGWPLICGGALKALYDLLLLAQFRAVKPWAEAAEA